MVSADSWKSCPRCGTPDEMRPTFREDYEIYNAQNGTVRVAYSGHCTVCPCHLDFESEHPIP